MRQSKDKALQDSDRKRNIHDGAVEGAFCQETETFIGCSRTCRTVSCRRKHPARVLARLLRNSRQLLQVATILQRFCPERGGPAYSYALMRCWTTHRHPKAGGDPLGAVQRARVGLGLHVPGRNLKKEATCLESGSVQTAKTIHSLKRRSSD